MSDTTYTSVSSNAVAGLFRDALDAQMAVNKLFHYGLSTENIKMIRQLIFIPNEKIREEVYDLKGFTEADLVYFNGEIESGKTLVAVDGIENDRVDWVIDILSESGSNCCPEGFWSQHTSEEREPKGIALAAAAHERFLESFLA